MLYAGVAAAFQNVQEAHQVAFDVDMRMIDRIAHAGLGGQMDDIVRPHLGEQRLHPFPVGQVELPKGKGGKFPQLIEPGLFQRRVVIVVEVVDAGHADAGRDQPPADRIANKAGCAGHQHVAFNSRHAVPSPSSTA